MREVAAPFIAMPVRSPAVRYKAFISYSHADERAASRLHRWLETYRIPARVMLHVKGSGLGLFIVRSVAERHGGRVFAESGGEGMGSTFTIVLPKA